MFRKLKAIKKNPFAQAMAKCMEKADAKQRQLASFLQRKSQRLSFKSQKIILVIFCATGAIMCINIIVAGFFPGHRPVIIIQPITTPRHSIETGEPGRITSNEEDKNILAPIQLFRQYEDSLKKERTGSLVYDSLKKARPGLFDSISRFEKLYSIKP